MTSKSLWMNVDVAPNARPVAQDESCDVVVVGAGIAGVSTAYELAQRNLSVLVIDRGIVAGGMTARTTAHLAPLCDDLMSEFQKLRGAEAAKLFYESQAAAVDRIEAIAKREGIDCDFRRLDGFLFLGKDTPPKMLDDEFAAVVEAGAPAQRVAGVALQGCGDRPALRYPDQGTFHPLKYLAGVVAACEKKGVRFFRETAVEEIAEEGPSVIVKTARASIRAAKAVVATNSPISDRFTLHTKMAPYRTYAMAFAIRSGALPDALYWDTEDPYHYIRLQPGEGGKDIVIVGGEDHKSGEADDGAERFERLEKWVRPLIPALEDVRYRWSGQVLDTIDYAGFIGRDPGSQNIFVHTGDSGQGMTHGVMGAMLNAALIAGEMNPWADVYAPDRKPVRAITNYLGENLTALKSFSEYVAPGEIDSADDLKPGEGAILRQGLQKIAAYRDDEGKLTMHSAACTHVGCHLHWNSFERCWDCPCHGSIFDVDGRPLNAPAISKLARAQDDAG